MNILICALIIVTILISGCATQQTKEEINTITQDKIPAKEEKTETEPIKADDPENKNDTVAQLPVEKNQTQNLTTVQKTKETKTVSIPSSIENNCIGFLTGGDPHETKTIAAVGAGWARPHSGPFAWGAIERPMGNYDFSESDEYVRIAQRNNITVLATIWPFIGEGSPNCKVSEQDQFYPRDPMGRLGIPAYRCKPSNMEAYKKFLAALVERYDGDGKDDMPGLEIPIKYWEVSNEPELKSPTLTFFIGNENDYLEILKESYVTIKQTCEDCKVLHGGAAGASEEFLAFWDNVFAAGGGNYFDIANIHSISSPDVSDLNVGAFKSLLKKHNINKPIWVTEAEFRSSSGNVITSTKNALDTGASKIFFVSFQVGGHGPPVARDSYNKDYKEAVKLCEN